MKTFFAFVLATLVLQSQGCDLNEMARMGPEQIRHMAENALQDYFPHARVSVLPEQEIILGLSCTANLGQPVIEQMKPLIRQAPAVQQLIKFRKFTGLRPLVELLGSKFTTYRYFALGFDRYVLRLDADSEQIDMLYASQLPNYARVYAQECGLALSSVGEESQPDSGYIWLGVFVVTIQSAEGVQRTIRGLDTLGVYAEAEFERARAQEVSAREELICSFLADQHIQVISVRLERVEKIRVPAAVANLAR